MPAIRFFGDALGRQIAYAVDGDGPPLLCPCWWVSHVEDDWAHPPFRAFFQRLAAEHTVVRYDRPGVGLSDRTRTNASLAEELSLFEALVSELGCGQISLLGMSCGGPIALAYAARHPERVHRLVLWGTYARGRDLVTPEVCQAMVTLVRAHWGFGSRALAEVFLPGVSREEADAFTRRQRASAAGETAAQLLELTYAMDASDVVGSVRVPTLVLHRRKERAVAFEAGRRLAAAIAGASLIALDGRAHPPWEGEQGALSAVLAFLRSGVAPGEVEIQSLAARSRAQQPSCSLDRAARSLVVEGARFPLTRLEWGVMTYLSERRNEVVTRDQLLRDVWGQPYGGSNVVDAVIRSLRKKLAAHSAIIETVTGHGYRFVGFEQSAANAG